MELHVTRAITVSRTLRTYATPPTKVRSAFILPCSQQCVNWNTYHMAAMDWLIVYAWYSMIMTLTIWTMHVCYWDFNNAIYWFYLLYTILCSCERDSIKFKNSISDCFHRVNCIFTANIKYCRAMLCLPFALSTLANLQTCARRPLYVIFPSSSGSLPSL